MVLGLFIVCVGFSFGADWPNWRGPNHDAVSTETDWNSAALKELSIAWESEVGIGFSAVSVANGKAYTVGNIDKDTDVIYCFDALTGKELWTYKYPEPLTPNLYDGGCNTTPTIDNGKVYTVSKTGKVFCLNADTGEIIWKWNLPYKKPEWGFACSPVIVDDLVVFNAGTAGIALDKDSADIVWKSEDGKSGYASAVPFEKEGVKYIASFGKDSIQLVETLTGKVTASYKWKTRYDINAADPVISGDEFLITSGYGHGVILLKLGAEGLDKVWQNKKMRSKMSGPVLIDGYLYGFDGSQLVCMDWKTGNRMWVEKSPKEGSLSAAGDKLIVLGETGTLSIVQATPERYQEISSAEILSGRCWTMPVLANGRIYARNAKGHLVCVDVQKKNEALISAANMPTAGADWPQWQGPNRDNISTETGLLKQWPEDGPTMLWSADGIGHGYSSPAISGGKIYMTGMIEDEGRLTCFDLSGNQLWATDYGAEWKRSFPGTRSTPTVKDGRVYVISGTGQVACFNADSGEKIWQVDAFGEFEGQYGIWGIAESPLLVEDKVIFTVGGKKAMVLALGKKDGSVIWTTAANGDKNSYCSSMSFDWGGKKIISNITNNSIFAVNAKDGTLLWTYAISNFFSGRNRGAHPNTPVVKEGRLFITSGYDVGAIQLQLSPDGTSVKKVWTNPDFDSHHGGFVVVDGYIYGSSWQGNKDGEWMCLDWETGQTQYEHHWKSKGSLTYADGMLYCYEEADGTVGLVKATPSGFELVSSFQILLGEKQHWAHPVVCGKRLYIRHGDILMAFDIAG